MRAEQRQTKKRKWLQNIGIIVLLLVVAAGGYAFYLYKTVENTVETMKGEYQREKSEKREEHVDLEEAKPFSVLIMGVDERQGDKGRSDTLIVLTINPTQKSVKMVSIPRDTRTLIVGKGTQDKINHSYAFGGTEMTVNTVEEFLDIPIDHYIKMNMQGFKDIVNAVGGITVDNSFAFSEGRYSFPEGRIDLNGAEALAYARMRKKDPRGDYGRQQRQRQVIQGVIDKGANITTIANMDDILGAVGKHTKTDITFGEMKSIQANYKEARHNIDQLQIEGQGTNINGVYYLVVPDAEKQEVSNELKQHLEI